MSPRDIEHHAAGRKNALNLLLVEVLVASCRSRARYRSYYAQLLNRLTARSRAVAAAADDPANVAGTACVALLREMVADAESEFAMRRRARLTSRTGSTRGVSLGRRGRGDP